MIINTGKVININTKTQERLLTNIGDKIFYAAFKLMLTNHFARNQWILDVAKREASQSSRNGDFKENTSKNLLCDYIPLQALSNTKSL